QERKIVRMGATLGHRNAVQGRSFSDSDFGVHSIFGLRTSDLCWGKHPSHLKLKFSSQQEKLMSLNSCVSCFVTWIPGSFTKRRTFGSGVREKQQAFQMSNKPAKNVIASRDRISK